MARKAMNDDVLAGAEITPEQLAVLKQATHGKPLDTAPVEATPPAEAPATAKASVLDELKAKAKQGRKAKKSATTKRTTLDLPEDVDAKFKKFCQDAGESKQRVLERLVRELISD